MNNSVNKTWINETNTKIYVIPALNRQEDLGFNYDWIGLTWKVTQFT